VLLALILDGGSTVSSKSNITLKGENNSKFADNTTGLITAQVLREFMTDVLDSIDVRDDIVDDLISTSSETPLSSNQGRILKGLIDGVDPLSDRPLGAVFCCRIENTIIANSLIGFKTPSSMRGSISIVSGNYIRLPKGIYEFSILISTTTAGHRTTIDSINGTKTYFSMGDRTNPKTMDMFQRPYIVNVTSDFCDVGIKISNSADISTYTDSGVIIKELL